MEKEKYTQFLSIILILLGSLLLLIGFSADETTYYIFGAFSATFGIIVYFKVNEIIYKNSGVNQKTRLSLVLFCGSILVFAGINFVVVGEFVPNTIFTGMQLTPFSYVGLLSGSLAGLLLSLLIHNYNYIFYVDEKNTSQVLKIMFYISCSVYVFLAVVQFSAAVLYSGGYFLIQILVLSTVYWVEVI